jgi:hypothetical protein
MPKFAFPTAPFDAIRRQVTYWIVLDFELANSGTDYAEGETVELIGGVKTEKATFDISVNPLANNGITLIDLLTSGKYLLKAGTRNPEPPLPDETYCRLYGRTSHADNAILTVQWEQHHV